MFKPYQLSFLHRLQYVLLKTPLISTRSLRKRLAGYIQAHAEDGVVVPTLYGFSLFVSPKSDTGLDRAVFQRGTYEPGTLEVIQGCLRPGDTFVDVGSNIGLMTLMASRAVGSSGQVYSIEADPANFAIMQRNLEINRVANVSAYNLGMSSSPGRGMIYRNPDTKCSSSLDGNAEGVVSEGVPIELQTLDAFMSGRPKANIRMLKVDAKGWELEILRGGAGCLSGPEAPILCVSYLQGRPERDPYPHLKEFNDYRVFKLSEGKMSLSRLQEITSAAELPFDDNLFCFLPRHLETLPPRLLAK